MITQKEIFPVGYTQKPCGIRGEIVIRFHKVAYTDIETDFYFLEIDGIPVPFFVEEFTYTAETTARVKFEDIDDETSAARYVNLAVFVPCNLILSSDSEDLREWDFFVGYTVYNQQDEMIGVIEDVDDSTMNVLFIVKENQGRELLIPAAEDLILEVDKSSLRVKMFLSEGLIERDDQ